MSQGSYEAAYNIFKDVFEKNPTYVAVSRVKHIQMQSNTHLCRLLMSNSMAVLIAMLNNV